MSGYRRKLIETALPLEAISQACSREKSIRHGHPATLHLWWSRKPLAACRAVLFASLVDDPASRPEEFPTREAQDRERERLFALLEALVRWENTGCEALLGEVREEIRRSCGGEIPVVYDPFAGGGSIPLEAQRLGLIARASDLNPVAVLLNKALLVLPARLRGQPPVHPEARKEGRGVRKERGGESVMPAKAGIHKRSRMDPPTRTRRRGDTEGRGDTEKTRETPSPSSPVTKCSPHSYQGTEGLVEDIRAYGAWMRDEALRRVGELYPLRRGKETVIAWLWCRAVRCPNPACGAQMPLLSKLWLSSRRAQRAWLEPVIPKDSRALSFRVKTGSPLPEEIPRLEAGTRLLREDGRTQRAAFRCLCCQSGIAKGSYIDLEARQGRLFSLPLAIVVEGERGRLYQNADLQWEELLAKRCKELLSVPEVQENLPKEPAQGTFASNAKGRGYGFQSFCDYFTPRQLITLATFTKLVQEAHDKILHDAGHLPAPEREERADAISLYLALAVDRLVDRHSTLCSWDATRDSIRNTFAQQGISMAWDFVEANPFSHSTGNFQQALAWITGVLEGLPDGPPGEVAQADGASLALDFTPVFVTDPPYYDNVSYANLSDFFFVWLKRSLGPQYPELFQTLLSPKQSEIVASPQRFDFDKEQARDFFEGSIRKVFEKIHALQNKDFPFVLFYACKQKEEAISTGWETLLAGLLEAGFLITGTWPLRTELVNRNVSRDANALRSSIVLVCRPGAPKTKSTTRREFLTSLRRELPEVIRSLRQASIAPLDLAQAAIGPGMAVFSRYQRVLEPDGSPMSVRAALGYINQILDESLEEQEEALEPETRWALTWFAQLAFGEGPFGDAELLSRAKNTSVPRLAEQGILLAQAGKVRLLRREELPRALGFLRNPPGAAKPPPAPALWRVTQHLIRALEEEGEAGAAGVLRTLGQRGEAARPLAYQLHALCERRRWPKEALAYQSLIAAWPEIARLARAP